MTICGGGGEGGGQARFPVIYRYVATSQELEAIYIPSVLSGWSTVVMHAISSGQRWLAPASGLHVVCIIYMYTYMHFN